jgi:hypothetical protein
MQPFVVGSDIWLHVVTHGHLTNDMIFSSENEHDSSSNFLQITFVQTNLQKLAFFFHWK